MKNFKFFLFICALTYPAFANYLVVTSDQVTVSSKGLFVNLDGRKIPVASINSAQDGYLVAIPSPTADICPSCGSSGYEWGGFCPACNFPDDDKYSWKRHAVP